MTHKLKMLTLIRDARERLRDVAAGAVSDAEERRAQTERDRDDSELALGTLVEWSSGQLHDAQRIAVLEMVSHMAISAQQDIEDAHHVVEEATAESAQALAELRLKERQLRVAEKVHARKIDELARVEDKSERTLTDDLVAAKWSRKR